MSQIAGVGDALLAGVDPASPFPVHLRPRVPKPLPSAQWPIASARLPAARRWRARAEYNRAAYDSLQPGDAVTVRYLREDPRVCHLESRAVREDDL
jgi:hypothetical protein